MKVKRNELIFILKENELSRPSRYDCMNNSSLKWHWRGKDQKNMEFAYKNKNSRSNIFCAGDSSQILAADWLKMKFLSANYLLKNNKNFENSRVETSKFVKSCFLYSSVIRWAERSICLMRSWSLRALSQFSDSTSVFLNSSKNSERYSSITAKIN